MADIKSALTRIPFLYRESTGYRTVTINGAVGSATPGGDVYMALYSDRPHLPESSWITVDSNSKVIGKEELRSQPGIVREVQVGVVMDLNTAINIHKWLEAHIENVKKQQKHVEELQKIDLKQLKQQ